MEHTRCLIIGSGPAGYTAAIYAGRANLQPVEYCGMQAGGQLTQTTIVDNFPGYPNGVDGNQMMMELREQAGRFGVDMRDGEIIKADFSQKPYVFTTDRGVEISADSVIIATGATAKYLGLPDEQKYMGQGVSVCATCDGFFYRKRTVAVVGGGDSALEEALFLTTFARKVYIIHRRDSFRASDIMQKRAFENPKIEVLWDSEVSAIDGDSNLEKVTLKNTKDGSERELPLNGLFIAIGSDPRVDMVKDQLTLSEQGTIEVQGRSSKTSVPGVFAAGDVIDPTYRQAIIAAGSGAVAALDAQHYIENM